MEYLILHTGIANVHFEWTSNISCVPLGILFILRLSTQPFKPAFRHLCAAKAMKNSLIRNKGLAFSPWVHYNSLELVLCASCDFGVLYYKELLYCLFRWTMHHLGSAVTSGVLLHSSWLIICLINSPLTKKSLETLELKEREECSHFQEDIPPLLAVIYILLLLRSSSEK